jgi:crotonobetainyl-CoA:carnitine CoA-transferase CaiB-like acyl-CoA transferase
VLLCKALGRPDLVNDSRFADFAARARNRDALLEILRPIFLSRPSAEWLELFRGSGVPSAPVNDVAGAFADPQATARGDVVAIKHPTLGTVRQPASPLRVGTEPKPMRRAPFRAEHAQELLEGLCGYTPERIEELRRAGAFGRPE